MQRIIVFARQYQVVIARLAIAVIYLWFGAVKLVGASPAEPLVEELFDRTLGWGMPFAFFYGAFALFEMLIGLLVLRRGAEKVTAVLIGFHLLTTVLPLLVLPQTTWTGFLAPTLVGQYIIKNVLILSAVATILGQSEATIPSKQSLEPEFTE